MSFSDSAIIWQVYPLGFTGAPVRPAEGERTVTHRLRHVTQWLDYAVELGVNVLQLGPIFNSETHGYDTLDFFTIDPRLGTEEDFDELAAACRDKGVSLVLDGVFNHVGRGYPAVEEALQHGASDLIALNEDGSLGNFEGHGSLVPLNHDSQATVDLVSRVMCHWLGKGADGWRLDAVYSMDPGFWARVLPGVREAFPKAWFVGEMIHGEYSDYVARSGLDSVTQYELWKAIWSSVKDRNFFELEWSLRRHAEFLGHFRPLTFVGNHDVTRIASKVGDAGAAVAAVVLFTVGGVPSVYYGDEQAFRGEKTETLGGDDAIRPMFPATPAELAPEGEWLHRVYQQLIALRRRNPWLVDAVPETLEIAGDAYAYRTRGRNGEVLTVELALGEGDTSARVLGLAREELFSYREGA